ncbi:MAG: HD domain-containing protein [Candidatus Heimdallarchaeum endolithica]|uniref:HD domain-containing protein n=1 Tax=Candidatus Heimdallarchaeum endolithica TaxID=2876572 RepID=A0A9Y1BT32_9ARCH|nr:MAG: HD domain-containing protein [Candidatus Heimdallarchaeum endolithica]
MLSYYKARYILDYSLFLQLFRDCYSFVSSRLDNDSSTHSFEHTLRVIDLCYSIGVKLHAFIDVCLLSALFHDVARPEESKTGECHAELGSRIAFDFLSERGFPDLAEEVRLNILEHRFSKSREPTSIEGKILQDADMLDALGSIGLFRVISFSLEHNRDIDEMLLHFDEKLFLLPSRMHFRFTQKLAKRRLKILKKFYSQIKAETSFSITQELVDN